MSNFLMITEANPIRIFTANRVALRNGGTPFASLVRFAAVALVLASIGCQDESAPKESAANLSPSGQTAEAVVVDTEPAEVELQSATAVLDDVGIVHFKINYEFTSGKPTKHYVCDIMFLGTDFRGTKPMDPGYLSSKGTITTGIEVGDRPVKEFEITLSEADSPQAGYHLISNTLKGEVEKPEAKP